VTHLTLLPPRQRTRKSPSVPRHTSSCSERDWYDVELTALAAPTSDIAASAFWRKRCGEFAAPMGQDGESRRLRISSSPGSALSPGKGGEE